MCLSRRRKAEHNQLKKDKKNGSKAPADAPVQGLRGNHERAGSTGESRFTPIVAIAYLQRPAQSQGSEPV